MYYNNLGGGQTGGITVHLTRFLLGTLLFVSIVQNYIVFVLMLYDIFVVIAQITPTADLLG